MFFNRKYLYKYKPIYIKDLHGYVLPHAGTEFTGNIISHTLRFRPTKYFNRVVIIYLPSHEKPNTTYQGKRYFHEYLVPWKSFDTFFGKKRNLTQNKNKKKITYVGINLSDNPTLEKYDPKTIYIVSADFSHYLPFQEAIELENKAAKSLMFRDYQNTDYNEIIDHKQSFQFINEILPKNFHLQWVGRSRSPGLKAVGYLSFLIRESPNPRIRKPNGIFVTVYDSNMNARECLGEWFTGGYQWTKRIENNLIRKVIRLGETESRLTGGEGKNISLQYYTITYLYKKQTKKMIRGWHGIQSGSFYLPDVMLDNTHSNGKWIQYTDKQWIKGKWNINETLQKLSEKFGRNISREYTLYESSIKHLKINSNYNI